MLLSLKPDQISNVIFDICLNFLALSLFGVFQSLVNETKARNFRLEMLDLMHTLKNFEDTLEEDDPQVEQIQSS